MTRRYKVSLIVFTVILCILVVVVCAVAYINRFRESQWEEDPDFFFRTFRSYEEKEEIANKIIEKIETFYINNDIPEDAIVYRYKKIEKDRPLDVRYKAKIPDNDETVTFYISEGYLDLNIKFDIEIEKEKDYSSKETGIKYDKYIKLMEDVTNEKMPTEKLEKTLATGVEEGGDLKKFSRFLYNYSFDEYGYEILYIRAII